MLSENLLKAKFKKNAKWSWKVKEVGKLKS
jgi:hypothetical protein